MNFHSPFLAFLPELVLLAGSLALFVVCLGDAQAKAARTVSYLTALLALVAAGVCLGCESTLFSGAYGVDPFSQVLKFVVILVYGLALMVGGELPDIRGDVRAEYYFFLLLSVIGLVMLMSCQDLLTLVVALQLAAFPLYLLVPMRREREGQRAQMEAAIKYVMFGIAANGIMLFGLSYLVGLSGSTSLPVMMQKLTPVLHSPMAVAGLALAFAGLFYKLAVFPFHFWTPDVYQGAANETAGVIASLPKIGAVVVMVRFAQLASPGAKELSQLLMVLAAASMFYGNLVALVQSDVKRLLGFSGIAHAGYALIGVAALGADGMAAALYYIITYMLMVLACFAVVCRISKDGVNVSMEDLAGLHRRSPLLALTFVVGIFALAGIPPMAGFAGKLFLLTAALGKGMLWLVILAVINAAIAIYYYLCLIREACFRDPVDTATITVDFPGKVLCLVTMVLIVLLGMFPQPVLGFLISSVAK